MRIGIISDTHIHKHPEKITEFINRYLYDVDMIIHTGDFTNPEIINILRKYKGFAGVWGNNDGDSIKKILKDREILRLMGYKIGLFHGHGEGKTTIERAYDEFKDDKVDIIIFGHSHQPVILEKNKVLMLNPGSPTYKRKSRWYSYIILELQNNFINSEIKFINK